MTLRALAPLALCGGCTIIFDADDLRHRDAQPIPDSERVPDAEPPDAIPIDADNSLLTLSGTVQDSLDEGVGGEGGRPVLLQIEGDSIAHDCVVTAAFTEASIAEPVILDRVVSTQQDLLVVAMQIPVLGDLAAGAQRTIQITVTQNEGATTQMVTIPVNGLDELTLAGGNFAVGDLAEKYSHIDVTGDTHFTGTTPVRLVATGDIAISAVLDVDGVGQTGGVQGCNGGGSATAGGCSGGGRGANNALGAGAGGGGGGYGTGGDPGVNASATVLGGAGGGTSGNDMLIPLATSGTGAGNRGAGGGGGGTGNIGLGNGGVGGGGGGVILVQAGGDIVISGAGALRSKGGDGIVANGSGGGGGAGGAILVRAGGAVSSTPWLSAPGGLGATATNSGGAGGDGRIRVDAPDGDIPSMATDPTAIRGPAWDDASPVIVRTTGELSFQMRGHPARLLGVTVDGDVVGDFSIGTNGTNTLDFAELDMPSVGVHELCIAHAAFETSPDTSTPEALSCIEFVYFP